MLWCLALILAVALVAVLVRQLSEGAKGKKKSKTSSVFATLLANIRPQMQSVLIRQSPGERLDYFFNQLKECGTMKKKFIIEKTTYEVSVYGRGIDDTFDEGANSLDYSYRMFLGEYKDSNYNIKMNQQNVIDYMKKQFAYNCNVDTYMLFIYFMFIMEVISEARLINNQTDKKQYILTFLNGDHYAKELMRKYLGNSIYINRFLL